MVSDAGSASQLAWVGAGAAALLLTLGMMLPSPGPVHAAVALLGVIFLLLTRHDQRLLLAPPYGGVLLLIETLATQTSEWRGIELIAPEVIGARVRATFLVAAVGASAAAAAALLVTVAPDRSVGLTAAGAIAAVVAFGAIARVARRRYRPSDFGEPPTAAGRLSAPER